MLEEMLDLMQRDLGQVAGRPDLIVSLRERMRRDGDDL